MNRVIVARSKVILIAVALLLVLSTLLLNHQLLGVRPIRNWTRTTRTTTIAANETAVADNNDENKPLCQLEDLTPGHWVPVAYDRPPYIPALGEVQQRRCVDVQQDQAYDTWEWQPLNTKCEILTGGTAAHFQEQFCSLAPNGTSILIVGDSINFDMFLSLTHLLDVPQSLPRARNKFELVKSIVCGGNVTLWGKRDFFLGTLNSLLDEQTTRPNVIVANRGAHYQDDEVFLGDMNKTILPTLQRWQQTYCQEHNGISSSNGAFDCWLVWRTTVPGHPNCTAYRKPFETQEEIEHILETHPLGDKYNWKYFKQQNELVTKEWLPKLSDLQYDIMDGYPMNILRGDTHRHGNKGDCLHTCLPGDDWYSYLFLHMMRLRTAAAANKNT